MNYECQVHSIYWVEIKENAGLTPDSFPSNIYHSSDSLSHTFFDSNPGLTTFKRGVLNVSKPISIYVNIRFNKNLESFERGAFDDTPTTHVLRLNDNDLTLEGIPDDLFNKVADPRDPMIIELRGNPRLTELPPACNVEGVQCRLD